MQKPKATTLPLITTPIVPYNKFLLVPNDEEERRDFWDFRVAQIKVELQYYLWCQLFYYIGTFLYWASDPKWQSFYIFLGYNVFFISYIAVIAVSRRFKRGFVYLLPISCSLSFLNVVMTAIALTPDVTQSAWSFDKYSHLMYERE